MELIIMEEESEDKLSIEEIKKDFINLEEMVKDIQKRNICFKLREKDKNEVKKLYQIYNILFQTKKVITRNQDFDEKSSINDFYEYLSFNVNFLKEEIYNYIRLIKEDDFDNYEIGKNRIQYYSEHKSLLERLCNYKLKDERKYSYRSQV